jgi:hypothetical protein
MDENYTNGQNTSYNMNGQYNPNVQNSQYMPNVGNGQYNSNVQNADYNPYMQNVQNVNVGSDGDNKEKEDDPATNWKIGIGVGIINIILVILCGSFSIRIISTALIFFLLIGLYGSVTSIKAGFKQNKPQAIILGIVALVLNLAATAYYLWSIIYTIGSKFN